MLQSDAIMQYLVDTYDTKHILSSADPKERALITQYLFFQVRPFSSSRLVELIADLVPLYSLPDKVRYSSARERGRR